jgi:hypothetical protein
MEDSFYDAHHFRSNTQERKPVTNSRDTQELLPEAGHEMLRIFFTHPAKTSLLQDFAFYEVRCTLDKRISIDAVPYPAPVTSETTTATTRPFQWSGLYWLSTSGSWQPT